MRLLAVLLLSASVSACVSLPQPPTVTYKDRNRDGRVDYAFHQPNGKGFDADDWAFYDDDFDGYYDRKREYGELMSVVDRVRILVPNVQFRDTSLPRKAAPRSNAQGLTNR